jgi:hypothetical protein
LQTARKTRGEDQPPKTLAFPLSAASLDRADVASTGRGSCHSRQREQEALNLPGVTARGAYPGKAPKLNAKKLSPEDIYPRVTYGYRRMPAREDVFTDDERMAITAYMKSPRFSN